MQSVYKFHLALAVLADVDQGKLSMDQKVFIRKEELIPDTLSPMADKYPNGDIELTIGELLFHTVSTVTTMVAIFYSDWSVDRKKLRSTFAGLQYKTSRLSIQNAKCIKIGMLNLITGQLLEQWYKSLIYFTKTKFFPPNQRTFS